MESQTSKADEHISSKCDDEDRVMIVLEAVPETTDCKIDEEGVRESVDDLGGIRRGIVVLRLLVPSALLERLAFQYIRLHTSRSCWHKSAPSLVPLRVSTRSDLVCGNQ